MDNKVSYILVGLFVIILGFAMIAGVLWLTMDKNNTQYDMYQVYINESVSGLNPKAPVKFKGVKIGSVQEIGLKPERPDAVYLLLSIEHGAPIKQDTYAMLSVNGLTGIAFIELQGGSLDAPIPVQQPNAAHPEIQSMPSLYQRVDTAINSLFSQQNSQSFSASLRNIESITRLLAKHEMSLDSFLQNIAKTSQHTSQFTQDLTQLTRKAEDILAVTENSAQTMNQLLQSNQGTIKQTTQTVAKITQELHQLSRNLRKDMDLLGQQAVPEITSSLAELRQLLRASQRLIHTLELNPDMLIFGNAKSEGPGE